MVAPTVGVAVFVGMAIGLLQGPVARQLRPSVTIVLWLAVP